MHAGGPGTSPWQNGNTYTWGVILGWLSSADLGKIVSDTEYEEISRSWIDEWMLNKILSTTFNGLGLDDRLTWRAITLIKLLTSHQSWWTINNTNGKANSKTAYQMLTSIFSDNDAQLLLGVNRYQDILWFNKESFEDLLWWLFIIAFVDISNQRLEDDQDNVVGKNILQCYNVITSLLDQAEVSGYKLEELLNFIK
jgi:hypothetical protein